MEYGIIAGILTAACVIVLLGRRISFLEQRVEGERERRRVAEQKYYEMREENLRLQFSQPMAQPADPIKVFGESITAITTAVTDGISKALTGGPMPQEPIGVDMGKLGLDENGGIQPATWFPDVEFDRAMGGDPSTWPTRGGWVNNTPIPEDVRRDVPHPDILTEQEIPRIGLPDEPGRSSGMGDIYSTLAADGTLRFRSGGGNNHGPRGGVE